MSTGRWTGRTRPRYCSGCASRPRRQSSPSTARYFQRSRSMPRPVCCPPACRPILCVVPAASPCLCACCPPACPCVCASADGLGPIAVCLCRSGTTSSARASTTLMWAAATTWWVPCPRARLSARSPPRSRPLARAPSVPLSLSPGVSHGRARFLARQTRVRARHV